MRMTITKLFNFDGKKSLINYIIGNYSTTGCVFNNAKRIQSNDTLSTVPLDSLFYIDSSPYTIIQNFNEVSIKFGALEEKTPLARAEWLKFISVFYGYEREASQLFSQIEENYNCNKFLIKKQNLLASMRVVWLNRVSQNQNLWVMNDYLYKTELLKDAGAEILTIKEDNVESLHKVLKNVHFVIDDTEITDDSNAMEEFYKNYEYNDENSKRGVNFLSNKNILTNDGSRSSTGISSWKEDYLVYPHLVLADLIYWFHPKLPVSKYFKFEIEQNNYDNHYWFRNIAKNSPIHMTSNIKCPTEIPDIITQTICINLDDYDGDYSDYYAFYDIKTFLKKYILMYWYLIAFFGCFLIGLIASVHYIYKGKILRKLKNKFSNKNIHYANNENVANHNFFILEDDDFE
ncbi:hypothetical protein BCR36DRAFT_580827 [Piromyces finnis]|uniref:Uncharacterized protein n=1 Tax=Piromyces finnis TaxID=1754191 RepID=A0A1Y1VIP5_9FUNG|nr:hypothetical protein BCR36DRAFT_580827 [Piromyces finnis]|eukprot:ORX56517.1 hypothetical protein BCR36DRAFT_580827 [Piromyces finnis]